MRALSSAAEGESEAVGFVGLGKIGFAMAHNMMKAGQVRAHVPFARVLRLSDVLHSTRERDSGLFCQPTSLLPLAYASLVRHRAQSLLVYDADPDATARLVALGAAEGASASDVASRVSRIITVLPNVRFPLALNLGLRWILTTGLGLRTDRSVCAKHTSICACFSAQKPGVEGPERGWGWWWSRMPCSRAWCWARRWAARPYYPTT